VRRIRLALIVIWIANQSIELQGQTCVAAPGGLIGWWRGDGDARDMQSGNNGTPHGNTTIVQGIVGQGFSFDGNRDGILIGDRADLQLQDFTVETWVKRSSSNQVSAASIYGQIVAYGPGGWVFGLVNDGRLFLSKNGVSEIDSPGRITDTNWHHVAVAKSGSSVAFFIDGAPEPVLSYDVTFVFSTPLVIGAVNEAMDGSLLGLVDELSIYDRALDGSEIQSIFSSGNSGKCAPPPPRPVTINPSGGFYTNSPTVSIATTEANAEIHFTLDGSDPSISSAVYTDAFTPADTTVVKAQSFVNGVPSSQIACEVFRIWDASSGCVSPSGLVSWWPGDGSAIDLLGGNNGTPLGNLGRATYQGGEVGAAFSFDGTTSAVFVKNAPNLQLQTFTIEAWIRRNSATQTTLTGAQTANLFAYGTGGYAFGFLNDGRLYLSKAGVNNVGSQFGVADTNWNHVAVTKSGTNVTFYVNGVADGPTNYNTTFTFSSDASIGATGGTAATSFYGLIDELGIYNRALAANEIQALVSAGPDGKCPDYPPEIIVPPGDRNIPLGGSATFTVAASGWLPLSYQWLFEGNPIPDATNAVLSLTNVQSGALGAYSVTVSNSYGSITSAPANLTISLSPTITNQPSSQTVLIGSTVTFTVAASGTQPLSYQWRRNNFNIGGATSPTLVLNNTQVSNAGSYTVRISNSVGSVTSLPAILTVASGRVLTINAGANGSQLVVQGEVNANYTIEASSDLLQWAPLATLFNNPQTWQFTDTTASGVSRRFYRLRKVP